MSRIRKEGRRRRRTIKDAIVDRVTAGKSTGTKIPPSYDVFWWNRELTELDECQSVKHCGFLACKRVSWDTKAYSDAVAYLKDIINAIGMAEVDMEVVGSGRGFLGYCTVPTLGHLQAMCAICNTAQPEEGLYTAFCRVSHMDTGLFALYKYPFEEVPATHVDFDPENLESQMRILAFFTAVMEQHFDDKDDPVDSVESELTRAGDEKRMRILWSRILGPT